MLRGTLHQRDQRRLRTLHLSPAHSRGANLKNEPRFFGFFEDLIYRGAAAAPGSTAALHEMIHLNITCPSPLPSPPRVTK